MDKPEPAPEKKPVNPRSWRHSVFVRQAAFLFLVLPLVIAAKEHEYCREVTCKHVGTRATIAEHRKIMTNCTPTEKFAFLRACAVAANESTPGFRIVLSRGAWAVKVDVQCIDFGTLNGTEARS